MQDDFFDDLEMDDEDELEAVPDWMSLDDVDEDTGDVDEFDMLRQKSARAGSAMEEISEPDPFNDNNSSFSLQGLTSSQRTILAVLVVLNLLVIVTAVVLYAMR